ncbi:MAG: UDP-2,3-diacylglucosamine diphosphatase [Acidobacteriaceae bacterium]
MVSATHDTLILSDVHLGSEMSRAQDALDVLESHSYRRLVLLGDIFSDLNFRRLTSEHWKFLTYIRKLSNPKRRVGVVWVEGNHDRGLANLMSHLVGVPVYRRYVWEYEGKRHLAMHGHQFDRFVSKNLLISRVGEQLFYRIQKMDSQTKRFSRLLDRTNTRWLRLSDKVASGAVQYARAGRCERVFCGHTHAALSLVRDGIEYYNSGSWVDARATFLTIDRHGVEVRTYAGGTHHHHPSEEREAVAAEAADLFEQARLPAIAGYQSLRC